jgi:arsenate reductase (glutaredoxin)
MSTVKLYGIPNCDSVKKTQDWFKKNNIDVDFHDYKKLGVDTKTLNSWCKKLGWEKILNKKSTTYRSLAIDLQNSITNNSTAIQVMLANNSIIKRPIIEVDGAIIVGFDEQTLSKQFKKQ